MSYNPFDALFASRRGVAVVQPAGAFNPFDDLLEERRRRREEWERRFAAGRAQSDAVVAGLGDAGVLEDTLRGAGRDALDLPVAAAQRLAETAQEVPRSMASGAARLAGAVDRLPAPLQPLATAGVPVRELAEEATRVLTPAWTPGRAASERMVQDLARRNPAAGIVAEAAGQVPRIAGQAGLALTGGGIPLALGATGLEAFGGAADVAERSGASEGQALAAGLGSAAVEVAFSRIADVPLLRRLLGQAIQPETLRHALKVVGRQAGLEFTEEGATSVAQSLVEHAAYRRSQGEELDSKTIARILTQAGMEGVVGALAGGAAVAPLARPTGARAPVLSPEAPVGGTLPSDADQLPGRDRRPEAGRAVPGARPDGGAVRPGLRQAADRGPASVATGVGDVVPLPGGPVFRGEASSPEVAAQVETGPSHLWGRHYTEHRGYAELHAAKYGEGGRLAEEAIDLRRPFSVERRYSYEELRQVDQEAAVRAARAAGATDTSLPIHGAEFQKALRDGFLERAGKVDAATVEKAIEHAGRTLQRAGFDSYHHEVMVPGEGQANSWAVFPREARPAAAVAPAPRTAPPGGESVVYSSPEVTHRVRWVLREADELRTSHDVEGRPTPGYPVEFQPRQRERATSRTQIDTIAKRLDFEQVAENNRADFGAPIVDADGNVLSGNGRSLAIRAAYGAGPTGARYRQQLLKAASRFGVDPEAASRMRAPVLVRELVESRPGERQQLVDNTNVSGIAEMAPAERAARDAKRVPGALLDLLAPGDTGDLSTPANRAAATAFIGALPESERSALIGPDKQLNAEGLRRFQAAIFAKAYGDTHLVAKALESIDSGVKRAASGLLIAAPRVAKMRAAIAAGELHGLDVSPDVAAAVSKLAELRATGQRPEVYLAQQDIFAPELSPEARELLRVLSEGEVGKSQRRVGLFLARYADLVDQAGNPKQQGLFGAQAPPSKLELIQEAERTYDRAEQQDQPALFGSGPGAILGELFGNQRAALPEPKSTAEVASLNQEVEKRFQSNRGIRARGILQRVKEATARLLTFRRPIPEIDRKATPQMARLGDILRRHHSAEHAAVREAFDIVDEVTKGLSPQQGDLFSRVLILPDLVRDIEAGRYNGEKELPFGYADKAEIEKDLAHFESIVARPEHGAVREALQKRQETVRRVTERLVELELLPESVLADPRYYHRQVMAHLDPDRAPGGGGVRIFRRGFQKQRTGGGDFNTDYQQAEFEWLSDALQLIEKRQTLDRLREEADIAPDLQRKAKRQNWETLVGGPAVARHIEALRSQKRSILAGAEISEKTGRPLLDADQRKAIAALNEAIWKLDPLMPFHERFAIALSRLQKLQGFDADEGLFGEADESEKLFATLKGLADNGSADEKAAALMALKAIAEKNAFIKRTLGERFVRWQQLAPEGHALWQPEKGNRFYSALTIPERALDQVLAGDKELQREDVREVLAIGGKKTEWAIPEGLAGALERMGSATTENDLTATLATALTTWKQWTLLNPLRAIRYNLNNLSGDLDAAIAVGGTKILRRAPRAARELLAYHMKRAAGPELKARLQRLQRLGVIDSGLTIEEIPDVNREGMLRALYARQTGLGAFLVKRYWDNVKNFTVWRENTLRLAAYEFFREEWGKGRRNYGASVRSEVDAIRDPEERAAKLAREAIGDYGDISHAGQHIRRHMMPFYSWMEINAPRYVRLFANAATEGRLARAAGAGAARAAAAGAGATVSLGARAAALYSLIALWNRLVFPDEEKELGDSAREQHIIVGRDDDTGEVKTIRFEGALADALEWFGMQDLPTDIAELATGRKTVADQAAEAVKAPIERVAQAWEPFTKTAGELILGRSAYPRVFERGTSFNRSTRPIRDRVQHALGAVSLDAPYEAAAKIPARHPSLGGRLGEAANPVRRTDPGEQAYWEVHERVGRFLREHDSAQPTGFDKNDRQMALYYWKKAVRFDDAELAAHWLQRYRELGGTQKGMGQSLQSSGPLGGLSKEKRRAFFEELRPDERDRLAKALRWYRETFEVAR